MILGIVAIATMLLLCVVLFFVGKNSTSDAIKYFKENM